MNKIYRTLWNETTRAWVAVAEVVKGRGKPASSVTGNATAVFLVKPLVVALACMGLAHATPPAPTQLPTGGKVVAGSAAVNQTGATMNIAQSSQRAVIDWQTFNVGSAAAVTFQQPAASSVTLNRVLDINPSQIYGRVSANGQVFFTNPNGMYFAPGASVDVGGLVATTHTISNDDFMAGNIRFMRNGAAGSIVNDGSLTASLNGYIALLAPEVRNNGVVVAQLGTVALAAGEAYELQFDGNNTLANIRVEPATLAALVENKNAVHAPGGLIVLSAQAADRLKGGVVKNTGTLEATGLADNGGTIRLTATDRIEHSGVIDASAGSAGKGGSAILIADLANPESRAQIDGSVSARGGAMGGDGGFIETSAGRVKIGSGARITAAAPKGEAGRWLIDPDGFTIAASGGDMTGAALSAALDAGGGTNVAIASTSGNGSDGNINVNDAVTWHKSKLTLTATKDVNINAVMTAGASDNTGTAGTFASLDLEPGSGNVNVGLLPSAGGFAGRVDFVKADGTTARSGTGFLTIGGQGYTVITAPGADQNSTTKTDLQGIKGDLAANYALGANIDASATSTWDGGKGFLPIGDSSTSFGGRFDGLGHTIDRLKINRSADAAVGLFGIVAVAGTIKNLTLSNVTVTGNAKVGALVGENHGTIANAGVASGTVAGVNDVGGLVGSHAEGTIAKSYAAASVTAGGYAAGGLVGDSSGAIADSYATGAVRAASYNAGGLVGFNYGGSIVRSYATGAVSSGDVAGGLVGGNYGGAIDRSYATGAVSGGKAVGGLVGMNKGGDGSDGDAGTGGARGTNGAPGYGASIRNSYALGNVSGGASAGGLVGENQGGNGGKGANGYGSYTYGLSYCLPTPGGSGGAGGDATISNSFATGRVTASGAAGGLIGVNRAGTAGTAGLALKTKVSGATDAMTDGPGGLGGASGAATVSNSFYDKQTTGLSVGIATLSDVAGKVYGMTTADMKLQPNFASATAANGTVNPGWDFVTTPIWQVLASAYPSLVAVSSGGTSGGGTSGGGTSGGGTSGGTGGNGPSSIPVYLRLITGSSVYGDAPILAYALYDAASGGSLVGAASPSGTVTWSVPLSAKSAAGSYSETYVGGLTVGAGYTLSAGSPVTWTITPRAIAVTANAASKTYGAADPALAYAITSGSLVNGDSLSGALARAAGRNVGNYAISQGSLSGSGNYTLTFNGANFAITKAPLTVAANNDTRTYDGKRYSGGNGVSYTGLVNGDTAAALTGTVSYDGTSQGATNAGSYSIVPAGLSAANYEIRYADGTLTIAKAPLTVTANDAGKVYDGLAYAGGNGVRYAGFVNGEDTAALGGSLSYTGSSQGAINAGSYAIAPAGLTAANYDIRYGNGTLTIAKAPLTVTANDDAKVADGTPYSGGKGASYSGFVHDETGSVLGGALVYAGSSQGAASAGTYAIQVSGLTAANYALSYVDGKLVITVPPPPAPVTPAPRVDAAPAAPLLVSAEPPAPSPTTGSAASGSSPDTGTTGGDSSPAGSSASGGTSGGTSGGDAPSSGTKTDGADGTDAGTGGTGGADSTGGTGE